MSRVVLTQDVDSIERAISAALEHVSLETLVRGRRVAVKPNDTWASPSGTPP